VRVTYVTPRLCPPLLPCQQRKFRPNPEGTPGWNSDSGIVAKTVYAAAHGLQGMFSFRIDNDHGPWPKTPAEPTYHGHNLMHETAVAGRHGSGVGAGMVLNTYMSLHDAYAPGMLTC